jgi:hypothetical protein
MIKNRIELAKYFNELGFTRGAEIGVCDGRYSEILCQNIPNLDLLAVDSWQGAWALGKPVAIQRLEPFKVTIIEGLSVETAKTVSDGKLDFVFIDAEHSYESVKQDVEAWTPKVRKNGIVSGHDYYKTRQGNIGVIKAVNEYVDKHGYKLQCTRWDLDGNEDDKQPCWWFKK